MSDEWWYAAAAAAALEMPEVMWHNIAREEDAQKVMYVWKLEMCGLVNLSY